MSAQALVVCPLEFERRLLARAEIGRRCELACCGPGAAGVERWAAGLSRDGPVILCGIAGAVRDGFAVGDAWSIGTVVDEDGRRSTPPLAEPGGPTVSCPDCALTTPTAKRAWADCTDADLVDLESAAFARIAAERGWAWGVVRGVSDGPDTTLPDDVDTWVDERGRSRPGRVIGAVLRGRARLRQVRRLRVDGAAAMASAAAVLERMLER